MQMTIPLSHFVGYLNDVKQERRTWLDEPEWLIDNFRFDNESAAYDPQPEPACTDRDGNFSLAECCPEALPEIEIAFQHDRFYWA